MKGRKHQFRILSSRFWWAYPILILSLSGSMGYVLLKNGNPAETGSQVMIDCATEDPENFACWKSRYEIMVETQPTKDAFVDVRQAYDTIPYVKSNCHQIAHIIGRTAGHKYQDVAKAYAEGDEFCWSGFYHGVMEAIAEDMGAENVVKNADSICASVKKNQEYSFYHYNCVHGLGHGLMAVQSSELFVALESCNRLVGSWDQQSCYGGVFMENVMNEINPGHKTTYLKTDEPLYPCTAVENRYKQQCYLMQTSHALLVLNQDFQKVFDLCGSVTSPYDETCYQSLGRDASGSTVSDQARTIQLCNLGRTAQARQQCFVGAVKDFISFHHSDQQGLAMCQAIDEEATRKICSSTAVEYYKTF